MKNRMLPAVLGLLLVLASVGGVGQAAENGVASPSQSEIGVAIKAGLAEAAKHPQVTGSKVTSFITVFTDADGSLYALIDQSMPGAPTGEIAVNGTQMKALGLKRIDFVAKRYAPPVSKAPTLKPTAAPVGTAAIGINNRTKTWWGDWSFDHSGNDWTTFTRAGGIAIGCENKTSHVIHVHCTLAKKATESVVVSSKLTFDQILEVGFERGLTYEDTVSMTIDEVPAMTRYRMTPMAERYHASWVEHRDQWQCETPAWWNPYCIDGTARIISGQDYNATGRRLDMFYGSLTDEPARP